MPHSVTGTRAEAWAHWTALGNTGASLLHTWCRSLSSLSHHTAQEGAQAPQLWGGVAAKLQMYPCIVGGHQGVLTVVMDLRGAKWNVTLHHTGQFHQPTRHTTSHLYQTGQRHSVLGVRTQTRKVGSFLRVAVDLSSWGGEAPILASNPWDQQKWEQERPRLGGTP